MPLGVARAGKIQNSLRIGAGCSESSLFASTINGSKEIYISELESSKKYVGVPRVI